MRVSFSGAYPFIMSSLTSGICYWDNANNIMCSPDGLTPPSVDPLMLIDFARAFTHSAVYPSLFIISVVCGAVAMIVAVTLLLPSIYNWRHSRNLHFASIVASLGSAFFLLLSGLMTTFGVSGAMLGLSTVSLQVVAVERGILLESFVWSAFSLWTLIFLWTWYVRWWEILDRREVKTITERENRKRAEMKNSTKVEDRDVSLQGFAAAQM